MNSLEARLRQRIADGGALPFAEFMEEALYGEGGYYATDSPRIGPDGDFVTGSTLSPLFGASTARLVERLAGQLGGAADLLEAGYGDGRHLRALLEVLPPDLSGRRLAWDRVERPLPAGVEQLGGLETTKGRPIRGLVFSYELLDALPFDRFRRTSEGWELLQVGLENGELNWVTRPLLPPTRTVAVAPAEGMPPQEEGMNLQEADTIDRAEGAPALPEVFSTLPAHTELALYAELTKPGQIVDLSPAWRTLYRQLADSLETGLLVTCDYGYERRRLLDARIRMHGTLACYRRQTVHRNPFVDIGRQDITAHLDFTTLIEEGEKAGLETLGFVTQAEWLGACGVFENLQEADAGTRMEAAQLLNPEGMGTAIRVLVQGRGVVAKGLFDLPLG